MNQATDTNVTDTTTTAGATATAVAATPKAPSKKSLALAIFQAKLVERTQGLFASNKEFRASVLRAIESELSVSTASAATMYNAAKLEAEKADATVALGRDPKRQKPVSTGKRGRPAGSRNKAKEEAAPADDATVVVTETAPAAEVAPVAEPAEAVV